MTYLSCFGRWCRCVIQLGDLQSEEERDVLLEMSLPATGEEAKDWVIVHPKLTYFNVISSMMEEVAVDLKVQRCQEGKQLSSCPCVTIISTSTTVLCDDRDLFTLAKFRFIILSHSVAFMYLHQ